ncbi:hypothetical protein Y032_0247g68 [Ancylostoma ceylanicum]|uniref:Uncharacterized protein n=1 Tax=Ancylostoma ceylanicum TaxID=53326 RepID=A0A016SDJ7_9BILA|nr:hypothetical protein Y032_0247g68 [Ancylostoma ceylanicum]
MFQFEVNTKSEVVTSEISKLSVKSDNHGAWCHLLHCHDFAYGAMSMPIYHMVSDTVIFTGYANRSTSCFRDPNWVRS